MFSYDTPLSPGGLYISLVSWQSFGEEFLNLDHERTGNSIYLHEKAWKVAVNCTQSISTRTSCA